MRTLPVFVAHWEIECCGTPPSVGDTVRWRLDYADDDIVGGWLPETRVSLENATVTWVPLNLPARSEDTGERRYLRVVSSDGVQALWRAIVTASELPERVTGPITGGLFAGWHGGGPEPVEAVAPVTGRVARVRVARQRYHRPTRESAWEPVAGTEELRDVETSPKWFGRDDHPDPDIVPRTMSLETGIVVDLVVEPPLSSSPG